MARSLNKLAVFLLVLPFLSFAQNAIDPPADYKNRDEFKHFNKRRQAVSKWQINQLKSGALLVRLHDSKFLAEQLRKRGQSDLALQKEHEAFAINKLILRAFIRHYTFSKVYFFFSDKSDTLLKGARTGIFLDTNLTVDPSITMSENFYLIAEKDDIYNSSIGFVREDTARFVKETGNAVKEAPIVIKNKYSHQLKEPFPFFSPYNAKALSQGGNVTVMISYGGRVLPVSLNKRNAPEKHYTYVQYLNKSFEGFYQPNKNFVVNNPEIAPFLY
jgi:hypothetical protein